MFAAAEPFWLTPPRPTGAAMTAATGGSLGPPSAQKASNLELAYREVHIMAAWADLTFNAFRVRTFCSHGGLQYASRALGRLFKCDTELRRVVIASEGNPDVQWLRRNKPPTAQAALPPPPPPRPLRNHPLSLSRNRGV